jgi:UDP-3-O-[3-hydroxymyristoyl] glucosamine N-acyltransferase
VAIRGVASVQAATAEQITWIADARHVPRLSASQAGAVLVRRDFAETPMPALVVESVDHGLAMLLDLFAPQVPRPAPGVHATAVVAESTRLGREVAIGPYAVIEAGAVIGDRACLYAGVHVGAESTVGVDCVLWNHVVIRERCVIGDRVILHPHVVIGSDGFGYYFAEGRHHKLTHGGRVVIADDVEIGAGSCVDRSKVEETYIGPGTKIDNLVQVGHNVRIGPHCIVVANTGIGGSAVLGEGVVLAGHVGLRDNIELHDEVRVGACSCVSRDVGSGTVSGIPAVEHGQWLREQAALRKLPDLVTQVRQLAQRVKDLESATNDQ